MQNLFEFAEATIERASGRVLAGFNWAGVPGQSWAIVGPNGSGKTTLLEALAGRHRITNGTRQLPNSVAFVGFREDSRLFSPANFYYQQRFEFNEPDDCPTAGEFLGAAPPELIEQFHLADLLGLKLLKLSNGQQRRLRIARGLLKRPEMLVLDDPFSGLDLSTIAELNEHLARLAQTGLSIVLSCRADAVPGWVSNVFELGRAPVCRGEPAPPVVCKRSSLAASNQPAKIPVIEMANVSVRHGGKAILEGVNWRVLGGERWAILGRNGSGKTTLLSLLCGDHPQAFANDVRLFGRRRGSGETIWDLKKRIGLASPEMHQYFPRSLTALDAVASGFCDRFAPEPLSAEQKIRVDHLMTRFTLDRAVASQRWWQLSTGTQRLLLLLRAIVKCPEVLILDEPFQGMDSTRIRHFQDQLVEELRPEQTLLMVVHDEAELPPGITHVLRLRQGRVVASEPSELINSEHSPEDDRCP